MKLSKERSFVIYLCLWTLIHYIHSFNFQTQLKSIELLESFDIKTSNGTFISKFQCSRWRKLAQCLSIGIILNYSMEVPRVRRENGGVNDILCRYELRGINGVVSAIFRSVLFSWRYVHHFRHVLRRKFITRATQRGAALSFSHQQASRVAPKLFCASESVRYRVLSRDLMRRTEQLRTAALHVPEQTLCDARVFFM